MVCAVCKSANETEVFHIHLKKCGDCDELYFRDYLNENYEKAKVIYAEKY